MQIVLPFKPTTTVYNDSGADIAIGKPVYISGNNSPRSLPTIALARADSDTTSHVYGLTDSLIPNNSAGEVRTYGDVVGLDTTAWNAGQLLYLSDTTAGLLTATVTQAIRYGVRCAVVTQRNASAGVLTVLAGKEEERDLLRVDAADVSSPSRSFNTNFTPHANRACLCIYSVQIDATSPALTVTGGGTTGGTIDLRSDSAATPTTVRAQVGSAVSLGGTVLIGISVAAYTLHCGVLVYLVPPNHNVRIVTTNTNGTPTYTIIKSTEILL